MKNTNYLVAFAALVFCNIVGVAQGQDCLESLIAKCRVNSKVSKEDPSTFSLRSYPFSVQTIEISNNSTALLDSIMPTDLQAISAERRRSQTSENPTAKNLKYPYLFGGIPDALVWVRNKDVVIIPRMLLFAPEVARAIVDPNDFIATFYAQSGGIADENDLLLKWFKGEFMEMPEPASLIGKRGRLVSFQRNETFDFSGTPKTLEEFANDTKSKWITRDSSDLNSRLVVVVLKRNVNGRIVRCIAPYQGAGTYASDGSEFKKLLVDPNNPKVDDIWTQLFSATTVVWLQDSDTVEITTIENVSLFRPRIR